MPLGILFDHVFPFLGSIKVMLEFTFVNILYSIGISVQLQCERYAKCLRHEIPHLKNYRKTKLVSFVQSDGRN